MSHSIFYNIVGHTRVYVITLTSPPPLPLSRPWTDRVEYAMAHTVAPPDVKIVGPHSALSFHIVDSSYSPKSVSLDIHKNLFPRFRHLPNY